MSGMAEVIAAHWAQELPSLEGRMFALQCQSEGCGWGGEYLYTDHAVHVAEELTKAGYGKVATFDTEHDFGDPNPARVPSAFLGFFQLSGGKP